MKIEEIDFRSSIRFSNFLSDKLRVGILASVAARSRMAFLFENLDVYKRSVRFATKIESLVFEHYRAVNRGFGDQLSRASLSIPLNIAEGNGRWHQADKRQFFWIARGSVFECVPLIEILRTKNCISEIQFKELRSDLEALGKMLTKLVQAHIAQ